MNIDTATCKHPRSQRFNYFDDQDVRQISSQDINVRQISVQTCMNMHLLMLHVQLKGNYCIVSGFLM